MSRLAGQVAQWRSQGLTIYVVDSSSRRIGGGFYRLRAYEFNESFPYRVCGNTRAIKLGAATEEQRGVLQEVSGAPLLPEGIMTSATVPLGAWVHLLFEAMACKTNLVISDGIPDDGYMAIGTMKDWRGECMVYWAEPNDVFVRAAPDIMDKVAAFFTLAQPRVQRTAGEGEVECTSTAAEVACNAKWVAQIEMDLLAHNIVRGRGRGRGRGRKVGRESGRSSLQVPRRSRVDGSLANLGKPSLLYWAEDAVAPGGCRGGGAGSATLVGGSTKKEQ